MHATLRLVPHIQKSQKRGRVLACISGLQYQLLDLYQKLIRVDQKYRVVSPCFWFDVRNESNTEAGDLVAELSGVACGMCSMWTHWQ